MSHKKGGYLMADDIIRGKQTPMTFETALAHGLAACEAVALADPGPRAREWRESAGLLRLVLRTLRPANEREMPTGRPPAFG